MRALQLSIEGIKPARARLVTAKNGARYYAVRHGEEGRGRWEVRFPLAAREFPAPEPPPVGVLVDAPDLREGARQTRLDFVRCPLCGAEPDDNWMRHHAGDYCPACLEAARAADKPLDLAGVELKLVDLHRQDPRGNNLYLLARGDADGTSLVFWSLSPGFRGGASFNVGGQAAIIAQGEEAQGNAGRMGGAGCPAVHVTGPCRLEWTRTGRLYGKPADWVAEFDGESWTVGPVCECAVEDAALNY